MAANSSLNLTSLDFDKAKDDFKIFLRSQAAFKDYDFEGSNINVLLDVLSYNTFLNSFYLNMVASESFLDSAQMRDSVISHAKELNYLPRSAKSARVTLEPFTLVTDTGLQVLTMQKGTRFSGIAQGVSYNFVTDSTYINNTPITDPIANTNTFYISRRIEPDDGSASYIEDPFIVYQGDYQTDTFVADYSIENQRFVLTDPNVDTDSITVKVTENSGALEYNYTYASTLLGIKNTDTKYFLQPAEAGKYEIVFGDDIIGRRPRNNAVITVEYRTTAGSRGNGVTSFRLDSDVVGSSGGTMVSSVPTIFSDTDVYGGSNGGSDAETIEAIRFKAPRYFQTQERAVTNDDYAILLQNAFPEIQSIAVFGGETFDPPLYGKVYVSVKLKDVDGLPDAKRQEYAKYLEPRSPLSIDAIFIEPENMYFKLTSTVNYNINVTPKRPDEIRTLVSSAIENYNDTYLNDFNSTLRYSRLIAAIDNADSSIVSNETSLQVYKKFVPFLGIQQNITIRFGIPLFLSIPELGKIHPVTDIHAISSSEFTYQGELVSIEDNGDGILRLVKKVGKNHSYIRDIGTVDYENGLVQIYDFNITSYEGTEIRIYGLPNSNDISVTGNNIFSLGLDELSINVKTVRE